MFTSTHCPNTPSSYCTLAWALTTKFHYCFTPIHLPHYRQAQQWHLFAENPPIGSLCTKDDMKPAPTAQKVQLFTLAFGLFSLS